MSGVAAARDRARRAGFERSCEDEVGRLLAVLATAVPANGRVLELGTGAGVGLAWLVDGLGRRDDVEVVSIERDPATAAVAAAGEWPPFVLLRVGDALELLPGLGTFDLVFLDAAACKDEGLEDTIAAVGPRGVLVVDDMASLPDHPLHDEIWPSLARTRERLLSHPELRAAELDWSSGVILCARAARA